MALGIILITCENCQTRFRANRAEIGEHGRVVRCSMCDHEWLLELPYTRDQDANLHSKSPTLDSNSNPEEQQTNNLTAPGFRYIEPKESTSNYDQRSDDEILREYTQELNLRNNDTSTYLNSSRPHLPQDILNTISNYNYRLNDKKNFHYIPILTIFLGLLALFILGMENIDKLERNVPAIAKLFHQIGIHGKPALTIQNLQLTSIFLPSNRPPMHQEQHLSTARYSSFYKNLEIKVRNDSTSPAFIDVIQVNLCNLKGANCKTYTLANDLLISSLSTKYVSAKIMIPADAHYLSIIVSNKKLVDNIAVDTLL